MNIKSVDWLVKRMGEIKREHPLIAVSQCEFLENKDEFWLRDHGLTNVSLLQECNHGFEVLRLNLKQSQVVGESWNCES